MGLTADTPVEVIYGPGDKIPEGVTKRDLWEQRLEFSIIDGWVRKLDHKNRIFCCSQKEEPVNQPENSSKHELETVIQHLSDSDDAKWRQADGSTVNSELLETIKKGRVYENIMKRLSTAFEQVNDLTNGLYALESPLRQVLKSEIGSVLEQHLQAFEGLSSEEFNRQFILPIVCRKNPVTGEQEEANSYFRRSRDLFNNDGDRKVTLQDGIHSADLYSIVALTEHMIERKPLWYTTETESGQTQLRVEHDRIEYRKKSGHIQINVTIDAGIEMTLYDFDNNMRYNIISRNDSSYDERRISAISKMVDLGDERPFNIGLCNQMWTKEKIVEVEIPEYVDDFFSPQIERPEPKPPYTLRVDRKGPNDENHFYTCTIFMALEHTDDKRFSSEWKNVSKDRVGNVIDVRSTNPDILDIRIRWNERQANGDMETITQIPARVNYIGIQYQMHNLLSGGKC